MKQMGRTAEATRADRGVKFARERSTERTLAADNRRIGKDEDNHGHNAQGGSKEADVSIQKNEFNMNEFMDKFRRVGKGDEVNYVPTNISPPTLSKSILPITNSF